MSVGRPSKSPDNPNAEVTVVFDPDFGDRLKSIWPGRTVWIVSSPANDPIIKAFRAEHANEDVSLDTGITSFVSNGLLSEDKRILVVLSDIDQHHDALATPYPYRMLEVIGAELTPLLAKELARRGFDEVSVTENSFRAMRSEEAAMNVYD